jgi:AraC-like DNA-binding protein
MRVFLDSIDTARIGFSSANSFSRAFKRAYGFSPSRV